MEEFRAKETTPRVLSRIRIYKHRVLLQSQVRRHLTIILVIEARIWIPSQIVCIG